MAVKAGALLAHLVAAHQSHIGGTSIHHHVNGSIAVLDDGGINEGAAGVAGGGVRHIRQVVHHFPLPSLSVVLGDADNGVQVLGRVTAGGPADVRGGHDPAVVQGVQSGDAEVLASGGLTAEGHIHGLGSLWILPHYGGSNFGLQIKLELSQGRILAGAAIVLISGGAAVGQVVAAIGQRVGPGVLMEGDVHPHRLVRGIHMSVDGGGLAQVQIAVAVQAFDVVAVITFPLLNGPQLPGRGKVGGQAEGVVGHGPGDLIGLPGPGVVENAAGGVVENGVGAAGFHAVPISQVLDTARTKITIYNGRAGGGAGSLPVS